MTTKKVAIAFCLIALIVACVAIAQGRYVAPPTEITGTILDATTKKPFEGAFVLASYTKCGGGIVLGHAGSNCPCHHTIGLRTAKDGGFSFPLIDGSGLPTISTIAPNQYVKAQVFPEVFDSASYREKIKRFSGGEIWLAPQEPGNPSYRYTTMGSHCNSIGAGKDFEILKVEERARLEAKASKKN